MRVLKEKVKNVSRLFNYASSCERSRAAFIAFATMPAKSDSLSDASAAAVVPFGLVTF